MPIDHRTRAARLRLELETQGVSDERVLDAVEEIPRHLFVPESQRHRAWENTSLPLSRGQTISQPVVVALMTQLLELRGDERVLEIGTGSGYQAAILGRLAREVVSIERIEELLDDSRERLDELGIDNVRLIAGDGSLGLPEEAPFDAILVTAAAPRVPASLRAQLAEGGRLVVPIGPRDVQSVQRVRRQGDEFSVEDFDSVRFVPLIGREGWAGA